MWCCKTLARNVKSSSSFGSITTCIIFSMVLSQYKCSSGSIGLSQGLPSFVNDVHLVGAGLKIFRSRFWSDGARGPPGSTVIQPSTRASRLGGSLWLWQCASSAILSRCVSVSSDEVLGTHSSLMMSSIRSIFLVDILFSQDWLSFLVAPHLMSERDSATFQVLSFDGSFVASDSSSDAAESGGVTGRTYSFRAAGSLVGVTASIAG